MASAVVFAFNTSYSKNLSTTRGAQFGGCLLPSLPRFERRFGGMFGIEKHDSYHPQFDEVGYQTN